MPGSRARGCAHSNGYSVSRQLDELESDNERLAVKSRNRRRFESSVNREPVQVESDGFVADGSRTVDRGEGKCARMHVVRTNGGWHPPKPAKGPRGGYCRVILRPQSHSGNIVHKRIVHARKHCFPPWHESNGCNNDLKIVNLKIRA